MKNQMLMPFLLIFLILLQGCDEGGTDELEFAPNDVIVKIKDDYSIEQVFELINQFEHGVETLHG